MSKPDMADAFVCPVISTENVLNSPKGMPLGDTGHFTIGGPTLQNGVPTHATNDDGAGLPEGPHDSPGDDGYSGIWAIV